MAQAAQRLGRGLPGRRLALDELPQPFDGEQPAAGAARLGEAVRVEEQQVARLERLLRDDRDGRIELDAQGQSAAHLALAHEPRAADEQRAAGARHRPTAAGR